MIISLHFPKTAGTSFAKSLDEHFGTALLRDYADWPINTPPEERNRKTLLASLDNADRDFSDVECIHGHFLPLKYLLLEAKRQVAFVTWMREPVERLASHYWYWLKTYAPSRSKRLHRRVVEEQWSLERFCLGPELQNFYQQFLWGFPLERFEFIGIVENYAEDFAFFTEAFLGRCLPIFRENIGHRASDRMPYVTDRGFRRAVETHHRTDVELYQRAVAIQERTRRGGLAAGRCMVLTGEKKGDRSNLCEAPIGPSR